MGKRATKTELQQRLDMLIGLKVQGHSPSALVKAGRACWQISEREVQRYLAKIKAHETQVALAEPFENLGQYKLRFEYLYAQALAEKNLALAHEILNSQVKVELNRTKMKGNGEPHAKSSSAISLPDPNALARLVGLCQNQQPASTG